MAILQRRIGDQRLLAVVERLLASGECVLDAEKPMTLFPGDDLLDLARPRGLPIGNLTSQFFANVLLDRLDHFIKEDLRAPGYVRYADDFVVFGESKKVLRRYRRAIDQQLAQLRLRLHTHKSSVAPTDVSITFLGFRVRRDSRRVSQDGLRRANRNFRRIRWLYKHNRIDLADVRQSIASWKGHVGFANSTEIQKKILQRVVLRRKSPDDR